MNKMAAKDSSLVLVSAEGSSCVDDTLILMALSGTEMVRAAKEVGLRGASEVFADRG